MVFLLEWDEELELEEEDLPGRRELLELEDEEEEDTVLFFWVEARILWSFIKTGVSSGISSSLRVMCLMIFCAALLPS